MYRYAIDDQAAQHAGGGGRDGDLTLHLPLLVRDVTTAPADTQRKHDSGPHLKPLICDRSGVDELRVQCTNVRFVDVTAPGAALSSPMFRRGPTPLTRISQIQ